MRGKWPNGNLFFVVIDPAEIGNTVSLLRISERIRGLIRNGLSKMQLAEFKATLAPQ
jgi:hypothetical protein